MKIKFSLKKIIETNKINICLNYNNKILNCNNNYNNNKIKIKIKIKIHLIKICHQDTWISFLNKLKIFKSNN
jgi:hypothetical protein